MSYALPRPPRSLALLFYAVLCLAGCLATTKSAIAESTVGATVGGKGGPFIEYHFNPLSAFDPALTGNPITIGGVGFGYAAKNFRLGGGGAGGFLWNPSDNIQFGMGYGGAVGEYVLSSWLAARLLIGGGGFAVAKVISETDTTRTLQKLNSGGFVLFYPSMVAEIPIHPWLKLGVNLGYFLPNISKLQSFTMGFNVLFGKL
jgi:hypothetical protein